VTEAPDPDRFSFSVTKDERVMIRWRGRTVTVVAGQEGRALASKLRSAASSNEQQRLLARATGNFKRGNERG